jgi:signal transduction histidine kinase
MNSFDIFNTIFVGMLFMMMLQVLAKYFLDPDRAFIYYCGYVMMWIVYFSLRMPLIADNKSFHPFIRWAFVCIPMSAYIMYFNFTIYFLKLKTFLPTIHRIFITGRWILLAYILIDTALLLTNKTELRYRIHDIVRSTLIVLSIYAILSAFRKRQRLANYFAIGSFLLVTGGATAMILSMMQHEGDHFFTKPLFFMQVGLIGELFCFATGLAYKLRMIEKEKWSVEQELSRKEIENQKAIIDVKENERIRIARELHDDIGSNLSKIALLSEVVKQNSGNSQNKSNIGKIAFTANEMLARMSEIVWSMNPKNDMLENLISYTRKYAVEYFEDSGIECKIHLPEAVPEISVSGEKRRNIFLCVKESLHNVIKHSQATKTEIFFQNSSRGIEITIKDNGQGFLSESKINCNGLENMKVRMEAIGGKFTIENSAGTMVKLSASLE